MKTTARLQRQAAGRGFTLIELLLTLVILLLLLGAMVINFSSLQSSVQLDEGAEQFESAIRFARAHAASTGCKVRFTFEEEIDEDWVVPLGNLFAEWERDPLNKPGQWERLREVGLLLETMLETVRIDDVLPLEGTQPGTPISVPDEFGDGEAVSYSFAPIVFYPDGSSDSAEIVISPRNEEEDTRRISVTLIGTTGVIRRKTLLRESPIEQSTEVVAAKK